MNVLITRAAIQLGETVNIFSAAGLAPYSLPMINYIKNDAPFKHSYYDYCIFTSPAAVSFFPPDRVKAGKYIAIGEKTAREAMTLLNVMDVLIPPEAYIDSLLEALSETDLSGKRVLAPGAETRIKDSRQFFIDKGAEYEEATLYRTVPVPYEQGEIYTFLAQYSIDAVTFFSPSAVNAFFSSAKLPETIQSVAIGRTTAEALEKYNIRCICPEDQSAESMASLLAAISKVR